MNPTDIEGRTWTVDSLLTYLKGMMNERDARYEQRFDALENLLKLSIATSERALSKAEAANDKRFEGVNEFRATLADQQSTLMPKGEYAVAHKALVDKIDTIFAQFSDCRSTHLGETTGGKNLMAWVVGGFGLIMTIVSIVILIIDKFGKP